MTDANSQFFAILTNVGLAKQANADALGIPWKITDMGLGDANLTDPIPNPAQTALINEWRRRPLNQLKIDPANPAIIIAEQIIPADEGGRWIREIGLYDEGGDLVAVANCAPSYKPLLSQGSGRTQVVRMNFIVNNAGNITLKIDPAVVLASRAYVDAAILEVLPANKTAGEFTRIKVNNRGVVVSGDNPNTLAGMGITDTYTKPQIESMIAQASEINQGTAKVATDAQMLDSANDAVITTPKKLRKGFAISLAANGYVAFPSWLGGLIVQWGTGLYVADTPVAFPIAFPSACLALVACGANYDTPKPAYQKVVPVSAYSQTKTGFLASSSNGIAANGTWLAIGN